MSIKFNKNCVICFLLVIFYFEPLLFKYEPYVFIDNIYSVLKIIAFILILLFTLCSNTKITKGAFIIILYELFLGLTTIINGGDIVKYCGPALNVISLTLITNYYFPKLKHNYIKILYIILFILVLINTICVLIVPNGFIPPKTSMYALIGFLGIENRYVFFMLPLIFYSAIYSIYKHKKLNWLFYFASIMVLFTLIKAWSVGAMLGMILLIAAIILFSRSEKASFIKKLDFKYYLIFIILLNILLVVFHVQDLFSNFIMNVLHKDVTLSARTLIWDNAIDLFKGNFLIGVGVQPDAYFRRIFYGVTHTHNLFLNIMVTSGTIGLIIYFIMFGMIQKSNKKIKNVRIKFVINISLLVLLFLSLADTIDTGIIFTMYLIGIMYPNVLNTEESKSLERG